MKARMSVAVMCAALAGCADCGGVTYELADKSAVASQKSEPYCYAPAGKLGKEKRTGESWGIAKLLKAPVHDPSGKKVAEIDDLLVTPEGRINTAILTVSDPESETRTISVPFKELKRSVDGNGEYVIRTTLLKDMQKLPSTKDQDKQPSTKDTGK